MTVNSRLSATAERKETDAPCEQTKIGHLGNGAILLLQYIRAAGLTAYTALKSMKYKRDYSGKTAQEWLTDEKWTAFLMQVPLGKARGYLCNSANHINIIRVIASNLSNSEKCDRKFSIDSNYDSRVITVTATLKQNDN